MLFDFIFIVYTIADVPILSPLAQPPLLPPIEGEYLDVYGFRLLSYCYFEFQSIH